MFNIHYWAYCHEKLMLNFNSRSHTKLRVLFLVLWLDYNPLFKLTSHQVFLGFYTLMSAPKETPTCILSVNTWTRVFCRQTQQGSWACSTSCHNLRKKQCLSKEALWGNLRPALRVHVLLVPVLFSLLLRYTLLSWDIGRHTIIRIHLNFKTICW